MLHKVDIPSWGRHAEHQCWVLTCSLAALVFASLGEGAVLFVPLLLLPHRRFLNSCDPSRTARCSSLTSSLPAQMQGSPVVQATAIAEWQPHWESLAYSHLLSLFPFFIRSPLLSCSRLSSPSSHLSPQLPSPLPFCKRVCKQTLIVGDLASAGHPP